MLKDNYIIKFMRGKSEVFIEIKKAPEGSDAFLSSEDN